MEHQDRQVGVPAYETQTDSHTDSHSDTHRTREGVNGVLRLDDAEAVCSVIQVIPMSCLFICLFVCHLENLIIKCNVEYVQLQ